MSENTTDVTDTPWSSGWTTQSTVTDSTSSYQTTTETISTSDSKPGHGDNDNSLTLGLGIGIPLGVLVVVAAVLIWLFVIRKDNSCKCPKKSSCIESFRKKKSNGTQLPDPMARGRSESELIDEYIHTEKEDSDIKQRNEYSNIRREKTLPSDKTTNKSQTENEQTDDNYLELTNDERELTYEDVVNGEDYSTPYPLDKADLSDGTKVKQTAKYESMSINDINESLPAYTLVNRSKDQKQKKENPHEYINKDQIDVQVESEYVSPDNHVEYVNNPSQHKSVGDTYEIVNTTT